MAQSSYYCANFDGLADSQYTASLDLIATPLDEACLVGPEGVFQQQWPTQTVESTHDHGWSAAWPAATWDPMDQQQQQSHLYGPGYNSADWISSPGSDQLQYHQQGLLPPTTFGQWPIPSLSPVSAAPSSWESFPDYQSPPLSGTQSLRHSIERAAVPAGPSDGPEGDLWGGNSTGDGSSKNHKTKTKKRRKQTEEYVSPESYEYEDTSPPADGPHGDEASSGGGSPARKKPHPVRNRAAAKRCREKMKQYERDLVDRDREVAEERAYLDECVSALRCEVLALKDQILQHGNCKCEAIQGYITRKAKEVSQSAV